MGCCFTAGGLCPGACQPSSRGPPAGSLHDAAVVQFHPVGPPPGRARGWPRPPRCPPCARAAPVDPLRSAGWQRRAGQRGRRQIVMLGGTAGARARPTRCCRPPESSSGSYAAWSVRSRSPGVAGGGTRSLHAQGQANVLGSGEHRDEAKVLEEETQILAAPQNGFLLSETREGALRTQTAPQVGQSRPPVSRSRGGVARP